MSVLNRLLSFISFAFLTASGVSAAQTKVGATVIEGKVVELFSDGTWRYEMDGGSKCRPLTRTLTMCDREGNWTNTTNSNADAVAMFTYDDRNFALVITEALGTEDGLSRKYMRRAVIETAAAGAGIAHSEVVVFKSEDWEFLSRDATPYPTKCPLMVLNSYIQIRSAILQSNISIRYHDRWHRVDGATH